MRLLGLLVAMPVCAALLGVAFFLHLIFSILDRE